MPSISVGVRCGGWVGFAKLGAVEKVKLRTRVTPQDVPTSLGNTSLPAAAYEEEQRTLKGPYFVEGEAPPV